MIPVLRSFFDQLRQTVVKFKPEQFKVEIDSTFSFSKKMTHQQVAHLQITTNSGFRFRKNAMVLLI